MVEFAPSFGKCCKQQWWELSGAAGSTPQKRKKPGRKEGWEWLLRRPCKKELARGHNAVPEEQMRSSYLRLRKGSEMAWSMLWATHGYWSESGRNNPSLSEVPR